uniref:Arginine/serine-rich protein 1 n=1 Tax=Sus scrofa TaxID=9823 RepID=A0A8D1JBQ3_PIG
MSNYVNDLWPGSPHKASPSSSQSGRSSRPSSASGSRSPSRSSVSSRMWSRNRSRSRSPSRRRSRSGSRSRRRHQRRYRRYSRSYSRSHSRSRSRRFRERRYGSSRRPDRSRGRSRGRSRSRSRSRSRGRSYYPRAYTIARGRRYYGFGRTEHRRSWRSRSRTRSRSPTPFRLSEKDRMELLEIAKANAAKALGTTNFDLPASLRTVSVFKETNSGTAVLNGAKTELSEKLTENGTKNPNGKSSQQKSIAFSSDNSVAKPVLQKSAKATAEETSSGTPKIDKKKSPYGLWIPV